VDILKFKKWFADDTEWGRSRRAMTKGICMSLSFWALAFLKYSYNDSNNHGRPPVAVIA